MKIQIAITNYPSYLRMSWALAQKLFFKNTVPILRISIHPRESNDIEVPNPEACDINIYTSAGAERTVQLRKEAR